MDEWLIIYGEYSDEALVTEIATLKSQAANFFNAQTEGNRSYARSTAEVRTRLAAATQVYRDRGRNDPRHGVADFSGVQP